MEITFFRRRMLRRLMGVGVRPLLCGLGVLCVVVLYLMYTQPSGVHIVCECNEEVETEERVARYLNTLMAEVDPVTNRTAEASVRAFHPSLAVEFLTQQERKGKRCRNTPGVFSVRHRNVVWQEADVGGTVFLAFGAYYDDRDVEEGPLVRVLVMVESPKPPTPTCHLWFEGDVAPTATRAIRVEYVHWQERFTGVWLPYIVTCRAGRGLRGVPQVASLVPHACASSTNALRVLQHDRSEPKRGLALCHKFIFNPVRDISQRLAEWIEAARAWGVDHITTYEASAHPNVAKILRHYEKEGFLSVIPWQNPGSQPNVPHLYRAFYDTQRYSLFTTENIPYTDCLLRHLASHRYVGVWDVDEFLVPAPPFVSIPDMIDGAKGTAHSIGVKPPTSYLARCSYFFDNLTEPATSDMPEYLHLLRHVTRTAKFSPPKVFTKAVHDTSYALGLHAHFALLNLEGEVDRERDLYHLYPASEGYLGHYRPACQGESQEECNASFRPFTTRDTAMWRYRDQIAGNTKRVLSSLGIVPP